MKIIKSQIINIKHKKNLKIISPVNIYGAIFGENCFVGPFCEIQKSVKVGDNTKIQSHTFICELVKIGKNPKIDGSIERLERNKKSLSSIFSIANSHKKNRITIKEKKAIKS